MNKVSVIMNCFNSDTYLRDAIDSVYAQDYKDWEIIFWDNASTDKSAEIAGSYDGKLKYFRGDKTVPLGQARNLAIGKAEGEYIAFLDCDDIWMPEKLGKQIDMFRQDGSAVMVYTNTLQFNEKGDVNILCKNVNLPEGDIFDDLSRTNFITLSSVMIKKDVLIALNEIFDERFSMSEDWDLWLRLAYGNKVRFLRDYVTKWRINPKSLTHTKYIAFFDEVQAIISKLKRTFPGIESESGDNLKKMELSAIYFKCIGLWLQNKKKDARSLAGEYMYRDRKIFIAYFLTFFPPGFMPVFERSFIKLQRIRFLFKR